VEDLKNSVNLLATLIPTYSIYPPVCLQQLTSTLKNIFIYSTVLISEQGYCLRLTTPITIYVSDVYDNGAKERSMVHDPFMFFLEQRRLVPVNQKSVAHSISELFQLPLFYFGLLKNNDQYVFFSVDQLVLVYSSQFLIFQYKDQNTTYYYSVKIRNENVKEFRSANAYTFRERFEEVEYNERIEYILMCLNPYKETSFSTVISQFQKSSHYEYYVL
jgi:hypothetical protein